ncbi:MAG: tRNA(Ile)-lysidine synthase [Parcubacteria group bacterium Gr01-1014_38]|nr:MAG: tRNA(Ile)-lysidine synthase [Parcubacteria group bacterium Gr01-1014_38]
MPETPEPKPERDDLLKAFRVHVLREAVLAKGSTVLVGVSGRSDSMALLRLLAVLARDLRLQLIVGHVQRDDTPDAKADATFVHHVATTLALPFESAMRNTRHASNDPWWHHAVLAMAQRTGATVIATGETQDDAAERLLAILLSEESSLRGLLTSPAGPHVRPLLPFPHEACARFLLRRGFPFRLNPDALALGTITANIRLLVLPLLKRHVSPDAIRNLAAANEFLAAEDAFLGELAQTAREEVRWTQTAERISVDRARWGRLPSPLRHSLLAEAARSLAPADRVSRSDLLRLEAQCRSLADGERLDAGRLNITRVGGILTLHMGSPPPHPA